MTAEPDCVSLVLQAVVTFWAPGQVQPTCQPLLVEVPVSVTVTSAVTPPDQ